jgi:hypothetical protein
MLLCIPLYDILVGLVLERWADADADRMAKEIERLLKKEQEEREEGKLKGTRLDSSYLRWVFSLFVLLVLFLV